ncbi:hypothetical protein BGZ80_000120 [Entomortierella chlamydospora]|uniref:Uncharacterized protein n=1 Tax=Entomortierella chlamydospora TaxID=101097 RepID=A0A9P6MSN5_9FUNG|nr:hypothetical protein BGZ79_006620 [Entomortierella chlamydospora]KAG0012215.1 hypothetical protein BGZ80_000120 [Entomortierella chlamydospora]
MSAVAPTLARSTVSKLYREVDVYGEWVDVCEEINNSVKAKQGQDNETTTLKPSSKHPVVEDPDAIQRISMDMECTHIQSQAQSNTSTPKLNQAQTRVYSRSKNRPTPTAATATTASGQQQQQQKLKEHQRKHIEKFDQTSVQVKGKGVMTFDDLEWDYSILDEADLGSDRGMDDDDDEDHYDGSGSYIEFGD